MATHKFIHVIVLPSLYFFMVEAKTVKTTKHFLLKRAVYALRLCTGKLKHWHHACTHTYMHVRVRAHTHTHTYRVCQLPNTGYAAFQKWETKNTISRLPHHHCTPDLLTMVMVQPHRNQRTHCKSSIDQHVYICHSGKAQWSYLYPKCKMCFLWRTYKGHKPDMC